MLLTGGAGGGVDGAAQSGENGVQGAAPSFRDKMAGFGETCKFIVKETINPPLVGICLGRETDVHALTPHSNLKLRSLVVACFKGASHWSIGPLVHWSIGLLVHSSVHQSVYWSIHSSSISKAPLTANV